MRVSDEDEVVQDTGTHGNQGDVVWVLMHRRQEATEALTQKLRELVEPLREVCKLYANYA